MKKIIKGLLIVFSFILSIASTSYIFAQSNSGIEQNTLSGNTLSGNTLSGNSGGTNSGNSGTITTNSETTNPYGNMGINMNDKCLVNGQCSLNIYQTLGIRKSNPRPDVQTFVQDIILALTNFFGTVVAVILVVSGLLYIFSSFKGNSSLASTAKSGIFGSLIGLLLVSCSYAIIRLIQFIATGGA